MTLARVVLRQHCNGYCRASWLDSFRPVGTHHPYQKQYSCILMKGKLISSLSKSPMVSTDVPLSPSDMLQLAHNEWY